MKIGLVLNYQEGQYKSNEILQENDAMESFSGFDQADGKVPLKKLKFPAFIEPDTVRMIILKSPWCYTLCHLSNRRCSNCI